MHIDIGARDGEEARERVRIGDVAVIDTQPAELPNGRLTSRALDNRLGSFVALEAARLVAEAGGAQWELAAVAAAQEEITLRRLAHERVRAAARRGDRGRRHPRDRRPGDRGQGVGQARAGLRAGAHPRLDPQPHGSSSCSSRPPSAEKIPFTVEAAGRATGTDADAVHLSRGGVPTALVSIPIRYMHSPVELVQLDDVHACCAPDRGGGATARRASSSFAR